MGFCPGGASPECGEERVPQSPVHLTVHLLHPQRQSIIITIPSEALRLSLTQSSHVAKVRDGVILGRLDVTFPEHPERGRVGWGTSVSSTELSWSLMAFRAKESGAGANVTFARVIHRPLGCELYRGRELLSSACPRRGLEVLLRDPLHQGLTFR